MSDKKPIEVGIDYAGLREKAEKALVLPPDGTRDPHVWADHFRAVHALENALNPQTVLALLDEIERLREENARLAVDEATGEIVTATFEDGKTKWECSLEDCECPEHEEPPRPEGTYIEIRLDRDMPIGLWNAHVRVVK